MLTTVVGEDALANLSIERSEAGIIGHVRIRSKTQGIALSLGDRITMCELSTHFVAFHFRSFVYFYSSEGCETSTVAKRRLGYVLYVDMSISQCLLED